MLVTPLAYVQLRSLALLRCMLGVELYQNPNDGDSL